LSKGDHVFLLQIDPAGERSTAPISSALIADEMRNSRRVPDLFDGVDDFVDRAPRLLQQGDFLLILGAGSIRSAARRMRDRLLAEPRLPRPGPELQVPAQPPSSVVSLFRSQVEDDPARPAVFDRGRTVTYGELDANSDALIDMLAARGVGQGTVVGVGLPRSIDLIVAIVALAKMGACYLPLDGSLPKERIRFMLSKAGSDVLITRAGSKIDAEIRDGHKIHMDDLPSGSPGGASRQAAARSEPGQDDAAYICFTSGSTGYPKGVAIRHRSLLALMSDVIARFGLTTASRMALNTSISFDVSLAEVWMTLCAGGQIVATGSSTPQIGKALADFLEDNVITHTTLTPSVLASVPFRPLPALTSIISIGEVCPQELADTWGRGRRFFNAYGPTEATIYATAAECRAGSKVTIGKALKHINTYVLDAEGNQVRPGDAGELFLGGIGVADGYIDLAEETAIRFSAFPREGWRADWIYRTGDLVKLELGGELSFLGRADNQIKLRGNRIELEEIESTIRRISGLEAIVCVEEWTGSKELICFVVVPSRDAFDEGAIREGLSGWLPGYMLPSQFIDVESIPLTSSGKKDRRSLLSAHRHRIGRPTRYRPAGGGSELASIWEPFHIDPGEIEDVLRAHEDVCEAAVLVRENQRGEPRSFVAYVRRRDGRTGLNPADLTLFLEERLPAYLIPPAIILMDEIPRVEDSTVDRVRLAQIDAGKIEDTHNGVAPRLLKELTEIFEAIIGAVGATPEDNVVSLGGDSLQAIHIAIELESRFGVTIPPEVFQEMPNILDLAQWIAAQDATGISVAPP
jgi:amino acid adenylation domain-containing protein